MNSKEEVKAYPPLDHQCSQTYSGVFCNRCGASEKTGDERECPGYTMVKVAKEKSS